MHTLCNGAASLRSSRGLHHIYIPFVCGTPPPAIRRGCLPAPRPHRPRHRRPPTPSRRRLTPSTPLRQLLCFRSSRVIRAPSAQRLFARADERVHTRRGTEAFSAFPVRCSARCARGGWEGVRGAELALAECGCARLCVSRCGWGRRLVDGRRRGEEDGARAAHASRDFYDAGAAYRRRMGVGRHEHCASGCRGRRPWRPSKSSDADTAPPNRAAR
ncbi:hypothetical protein B0H19DRAFT_684337 [Mycena capillaripes]|nr:hypothetical protein B0H19DRAFT_684337 [Mycena capillaripes]